MLYIFLLLKNKLRHIKFFKNFSKHQFELSSANPKAFQVVLEVKNVSANAGDMRDTGSIPGLGRSSGEGTGPTPVFLHEESQRQRSLVGYSSWGHKESNTTQVS